jgi:protein-tyrosine kinase
MTKKAHNLAMLELKEAIRELHLSAGLDQAKLGPPEPVTIGVTSPHYGDGKTTVSLALATSLANDFGANVMLVDADLHTHSIGEEYGIQDEDGLWEVLTGTATLESASHTLPAGLRVLPAGKASGDPAQLARSGRLVRLLDEMKRDNPYVVLDLPASLHSMTAPSLARRCNLVLVVVRAGETTTMDLDRTMQLLRGSNVVGTVINRSETKIPGWVARMFKIKA